MFLYATADVVEYPFDPTPENMMRVHDGVSFPDTLPLSLLAEYNVFPVTKVAPPEYNRATQRLEETTPIPINGTWHQAWRVVNKAHTEIAAELEEKRAAVSCSPRQIRLALLDYGWAQDVEAWVDSAGERVRIEWLHATEIKRTWPLVLAFAKAKGMTDEQLDDFFDYAVTL